MKVVDSQTWAGTFLVNSACNPSSCCCLVDSILLTHPSSNILVFNTSLDGAICLGHTYYANQGPYPTGYTLTVTMSIITLTITLNSDSSMLTISNSLSPSCDVTAVRQMIILQTTTIYSPTTHSHASQQCISKIILSSLFIFSIVMYD